MVHATDADGHTTLSFSDWRGRTVLTRKVLVEGKYIDTYTLYNLWGDVALVLQPMGAAKLGDRSYDISDGNMDDLIEEYAYVYRYDEALRPVYAKMPGAAPVTTVYDPDGLVAYTSDGNLRADGKCRFNLYDRLPGAYRRVRRADSRHRAHEGALRLFRRRARLHRLRV